MSMIKFSHKNRIPTFVEGNKLYLSIDPSYGGNKTVYHFKNIDVIMPSLLDFDIHNYSDEIVEYDRRRKGAHIISKKLINIHICRDEYHYYDAKYYTDNSMLDNTVQITNDKVIFYYLNKYDQYKAYSITFPKALLSNVECITTNILGSIDTIMFMIYYHNKSDPLIIELSKSKVTKDINMDSDEIIQFLREDDDKINYSKFLLSNI